MYFVYFPVCSDDLTVFENATAGWDHCDMLGGDPANDGVCYNRTAPFEDKFGETKEYTVLSIWNKTMGEEQEPKKKAILPSEDYLK